MQRPPEDASELERLKAELQELERRVAFIEHLEHIHAPSYPVPGGDSVQAPALWAGDMVPAMGRAILGLAGAYLLRALAETSLAPRLAVVVAAIIYAGMWLWLAGRERNHGLVYGATAAAILSPLLWEATIRFGVLPNFAAAFLIAALPAFGLWLGVAGWPTVVAASATAIALMVRTGDLLPFLAAALAIAALSELKGAVGMRMVAGLAATAAMLLSIWIEKSPGSAAAGYRMVGPTGVAVAACALPLIFAGGAGLRRMVGKSDVVLLTAALITAVYGAPAWAAGGLMLTCIPFVRSLALPLTLAGSFLLAPAPVAVVLWSSGAVLLTRRNVAYSVAILVAAAALAGFGARQFVPLIALSGMLCWWFGQQTLWARVVFGLIALAAGGLILPGVPLLLTVYLCVCAVAAASLNGFAAKSWFAWGLLAAGALKLLAVDFGRSTPGVLAASLLCYGAAVMLVPRQLRSRQ